MASFRVNSLQQRLILFLLLPMVFLLFSVGSFGWYFARSALLAQWREAAVLKVQRAAHFIDMRLERPINWIKAFHQSGRLTEGRFSQAQILEQLNALEGVVGARLQWEAERGGGVRTPGRKMGRGPRHRGPMRFAGGRIGRLTLPEYNAEQGARTVLLTSELLDESGERLGRLEVEIRFEALLKDILRLGWWQSETGYLTDSEGRLLLRTGSAPENRQRLGEREDPLERRLLREMKEKASGTVLGKGHPPKQVAGFCRTETAGWYLVLIAPGEEVLAPIVRFRNGYFLSGAGLVLLVLVLIRFSTRRVVRAVRSLSDAAGRVSKGEYAKVETSDSVDEIGRLTRRFNEMVEGLKERDFISRTFGKYVDHRVARRLLQQPETTRLGGEKREVAILMADIRGFTPMAETLSPEATIRILNHYFSHMIRVVERHDGIIVDFFGDSVLVFFDPFDERLKPLALQAVRCGLEMQEEMQRFGKEMTAEGLPVFEIGVGIHAGEVVVGNIGSEARSKYGIVGTAVNVAQRIQAEADGGKVLVSDAVVRHTKECLIIEHTRDANLKGIREPVRVAVVSGCRDADEDG